MGGKQQLPLIIRVDTTKSGVTPSDTFRIPTTTGETYKFKVDWGDGVVTSNHTGYAEHAYLSGGVYDIKIYGKFPRMFFNNSGDRLKLLEILDWGDINYSTNQTGAFFGCNNLTFIATDVNSWYNGITLGTQMFNGNSLTTLPAGMTLGNLTNGNSMFQNNSITSAIGLKLHKINSGSLFMNGANLPVSQYSNILVDIEANNTNDEVIIHFGSSKYNATGQIARDILTSAPRNWVITDGGLE